MSSVNLVARWRTTIPIARRYLSALPQHRESPHNNLSTPWTWTEESQREISAVLKKYPSNYKASATLPLLWIAQRQNKNWIPLVAMIDIARIVEVPPVRVFETCSFYSMFNREPVGKYHIQLCGTTPCMNKGSESLMKAIHEEIGIKSGETTEDGMFTVTEVECLGACVNAPMVQINDDYVEDLTESSMKKVIKDLKAGKMYKVGPQNGRKGCIGPQGKTSLQGDIPGPICRDLDEAKSKYEAAKASKVASKK
uniref:NADH dehydrogenase [ubiquinone] flavoprotein 2, mitochondrial n=1 Tax=Spongospora subterranea TaxID=70186 RepID=A0A0H5R4M2_9EUKA|eukprot:CRZ09088.1 hypothetical protein [Spongospora subterranea]